MRSRSVADLRPLGERAAALFDELEQMASQLSSADAKDSIGRAASLGAVLSARFMAAAAPQKADEGDGRRYLAAKDAARFTGLSRATLNRLEKAGTLHPSRPVDGSVRYDRRELEAMMVESDV